jgi:F0F1-type ATP synthase membrane subunit c/vacuolar-type H+-ATPase subunit K
MPPPTAWILLRAGLIVGSGWLLLCSIDGFLHYKALLPKATDPSDGIGFRMIVHLGFAFLSAGTLFGVVSTFIFRGGKTTPSDPSSY